MRGMQALVVSGWWLVVGGWWLVVSVFLPTTVLLTFRRHSCQG
ncbi:MAG TPA: hypothetical protein V6D14_16915 [Coleofasciculaceae cyanobacterium]